MNMKLTYLLDEKSNLVEVDCGRSFEVLSGKDKKMLENFEKNAWAAGKGQPYI